MKILIHTDDYKLNLRIPTILLTSRLSMRIFKKLNSQTRKQITERNMETALTDNHLQAIQNKNEEITGSVPEISMPFVQLPEGENLKRLRKVIKKLKKQYGEFTLVEVETEEGEQVKIIL